MFQNRQWYRHPVYGPMYIDRDLLHFIQPICDTIHQGNPNPELLAMPCAYSNYFCVTPPWHGYVQTFFDTTQSSTTPPANERTGHESSPMDSVTSDNFKILAGAERNYNHGQPLAHRDLDTMIMRKIETGQWRARRQGQLPGRRWLVPHQGNPAHRVPPPHHMRIAGAEPQTRSMGLVLGDELLPPRKRHAQTLDAVGKIDDRLLASLHAMEKVAGLVKEHSYCGRSFRRERHQARTCRAGAA